MSDVASGDLKQYLHLRNRRVYLYCLLAGLLAMFAGAFYYQSTHQGHLTQVNEQTGAQGSGGSAISGGMSQDDRAHIAELMAKIQTNPEDVASLVDLGDHFIQADDFERAKFFLQKATALTADDAKAWKLLGMAYYRLDNFAEAATSFEFLIKKDKSPANYYSLAVLYKYHLKEPEKAKTLFAEALTLPNLNSDIKSKIEEELK